MLRAPRLLRVGRESQRVLRRGRQGLGTELLNAQADTSKLSHRARRRISAPPMAKIERAVAAVGSAVQEWGDRFVDAVMRSVPLHQDATIDQVYASLSAGPEVAKATLEETFRAVDKASSDDLRVVGVQTSSVVRNAERLQSEWVRKNTDLIRAQQDIVDRVRKVVDESARIGRSVDDIRKRLEEQVGYAR